MKFRLIGRDTVFTFDGYLEVCGMKCVHGTAMQRHLNKKGTGYRNVEVETTARIDDVEIVLDVLLEG